MRQDQKKNQIELLDPRISQWLIQRLQAHDLSEHDADDIFQDVMVDVARAIKQNASWPTYPLIAAILHRRHRDWQRRQKANQQRWNRYLSEHQPAPDAWAYGEVVGMTSDLQTALDALTDRQRCVCRALMDGLTIRQIAARLRCRTQTVQAIIQRIRAVFYRKGLHQWLR